MFAVNNTASQMHLSASVTTPHQPRNVQELGRDLGKHRFDWRWRPWGPLSNAARDAAPMLPLSPPLPFLLVGLTGWINQQQCDVIDYLRNHTRISAKRLVSCLRSSFAESFDLVEDGVCGRGPDKGFTVFVVVRQILIDGDFEGPHIFKRAATNALGRNL
jgi:hypothetical protein